jgi:hypothetical protein
VGPGTAPFTTRGSAPDASVRLIAEARTVRQGDAAIGVDIDAAAPKTGLALHVEHLHEGAVIAKRQKLEGGEEARSEVGRMRREPGSHGIGQCDHLQVFGDAAHLGHGGLCVAHSADVQHLPKLMDGAGILPGGDVEPAFLAHFGQGGKVLRRPDRLLEE